MKRFALLLIVVLSLLIGCKNVTSPEFGDIEQEHEVTGTTFEYQPSWSLAAPLVTVPVTDSAGLAAAVAAAIPGDWIQLASGTYVVDIYWNITASGTESAPIWISPAPGATVHITRSDGNQNVMNIGNGSAVQYLILHDLEISSGSHGVRMYNCSNIWIDSCTIHDIGDVGISANGDDTHHLSLTRNEIHHTNGSGEGMYLGANSAEYITHHSIIAQNYIHDTGGSQGDGIELKLGSYANLITENLIHDTNYPCITVFSTLGEESNVIERNIAYTSVSNVMQVLGEAIVRNNLFMSGGSAALYSVDGQGATGINLSVVHNTFVNAGRAVNLTNWNDSSGMVFANNACYSESNAALRFLSGSNGVSLSGNVVYGTTEGVSSGFTTSAAGLSDFLSVTWDASLRDVTPAVGSALIGAGDASYATVADLNRKSRTSPYDVGAIELE